MTGLGGVGCIQLSNVVELQMSLLPWLLTKQSFHICFHFILLIYSFMVVFLCHFVLFVTGLHHDKVTSVQKNEQTRTQEKCVE